MSQTDQVSYIAIGENKKDSSPNGVEQNIDTSTIDKNTEKIKLSEFGQAALAYLNKGFSVIPLRQKDKNSLVSWREFQKRLPTEDEVIDWWTKWPDANIGIVTGEISGIVILDIDGDEAFDVLQQKYGISKDELLKNPHVKTGKGYHIYFNHPKDGKLYKNFARQKEKLDFRGDGGYGVAPPSIHPDGPTYDWVLSPFEVNLQELLEGLKNFCDGVKEDDLNDSSKKLRLNDDEGVKYPDSDFEKIMEKCAFVLECVKNARTLSEPEWHSALSIALFCKNGEEKAHEISEPYDDYSFDETQMKIEKLMEFGPKTCAKIQEEHGNECCKDCPVNGLITSPIVLGYPPLKRDIPSIVIETCPDPSEREELFEQVKDLLIPFKYWVTIDGIKELRGEDEPAVLVTNQPIVITTIFEDIHDHTEKVKLLFYRLGKWKEITMNRDEMLNNKKLEKYGKQGLDVNSNNSKHLVKYLAQFESLNISRLKVKNTYSLLGWNGNKFITQNGVLTEDGFEKDSNVMFHPNFGEPSIELNVQENEEFYKVAKYVLPRLFQINDIKVVLLIIGWFFAASIAPKIREKTNKQFPILNVWGKRGAGKSTLVELLVRMVGLKDELLAISSNFTLTKAMSESNAVPAVFDEYKPSEFSDSKLNTLNQKLKLAYRGDPDSRGQQDLSVKKFHLTAPIVIIGEDHFNDQALRERSVVVTLNRRWLDENGDKAHKALFEVLEHPEFRLEDFAYGFYKYIIGYAKDRKFLSDDLELAKEIIEQPAFDNVPYRNKNNTKVLVVGIQMLRRLIKTLEIEVDISMEDVLYSVLYGLDHILVENKTSLDLSMEHMVNNLSDFIRKFTVDQNPQQAIAFDGEKLYVSYAKFTQYIEDASKSNLDLPNKKQLKQELKENEESKGYILESKKQKSISGKNWGKMIWIDWGKLKTVIDVEDIDIESVTIS
ncbi:bifunctional DNA primase/polymerase [Ammoniphilus sp. CFH 90114]|uniref:bifunctional DNA primase/polymerase n=1 Tax=Ammoniphilus sp. CFH 90114 TaxID=2493665 RepID=UPI00100E3B9F|nr:bifunctional DNA primase/polymerase [Ammoniphilus sp. CFH 90114]RXT14866.1 DUF927 domain-containing protein [Ammoniphilus sp. CFH 90114]